MASGALFGTTNGRSQSKNLVEFRAGKMYMKGKMVHPDKRKGQVYIYQSEDSLMHFCWKDRTNGNVEDVRLHCHWERGGGGLKWSHKLGRANKNSLEKPTSLIIF